MYISATAALYFKVYLFWNDNLLLGFFVKIISIPDEELFSETYVGCTASYFSKLYDVPVGFVAPPPQLRSLRVAVARYRMICLVFFSCNASCALFLYKPIC